MNSGNKMNCAPRAAASSAYVVACLRFPSISWSSDFIWITAIRNDLTPGSVAPGSGRRPFNRIPVDPAPLKNKVNITNRDIFIAYTPEEPVQTSEYKVFSLSRKERTRGPTFCEQRLTTRKQEPHVSNRMAIKCRTRPQVDDKPNNQDRCRKSIEL